ncbi:DUF4170 domain-containing protein [Phenylobacterium immobile]|uniref:DUF4170 domain-containing protein n=1 Tax=Phenylobacterium immobile TaxID=21 RepID=UPI000B0B89E1|nr:DUF4170 domain-containing protein [Phenylobacterium immobile]
MADQQLLHLVIGGEMADLAGAQFKDIKKIDLVGAYGSYAEAEKVWREKAQSTVDNALMRYFIIHAHKLITPSAA